jgi:hypothetical protein
VTERTSSQQDKALSPTPDHPTPTADDDDQKQRSHEKNKESAAAREATEGADDNPSN